MGYLDPNVFGIVSQIGFVIFFGATTLFVFFSKGIKAFCRRVLGTIFQRSQPETDTTKQTG